MFAIPLVGMVTAFFSIGELEITSTLLGQPYFFLLLIGLILTLCPFIILATKGKRLFKDIGGTNYYCSSCLGRLSNDRSAKSEGRGLNATLASGRTKHYENEVRKDKGFILVMMAVMISGLIFGWLYGTYVKGWDSQETLETMGFFMVLVSGIFAYVLLRNVTPRSVEITSNGVIVEVKRERWKTIPFDKITWLNVIMDVQKIRDLPNAVGLIYVGKRGILQMSYRIRREIALDVREAYRANRGVYPPNGYYVEQDR